MTKDGQRRVPSSAIARRLGTRDPRAEFKQSLVGRFVVRFHMALMLTAVVAGEPVDSVSCGVPVTVTASMPNWRKHSDRMARLPS